MEVNVTTNKKGTIKTWIREHEKELTGISVFLIGTGLCMAISKTDICLVNTKKFGGHKGLKYFMNCMSEASVGANRWDAIGPHEGKTLLVKELGKIGEFMVEEKGFDPETKVTGLMIFTNKSKD